MLTPCKNQRTTPAVKCTLIIVLFWCTWKYCWESFYKTIVNPLFSYSLNRNSIYSYLSIRHINQVSLYLITGSVIYAEYNYMERTTAKTANVKERSCINTQFVSPRKKRTRKSCTRQVLPSAKYRPTRLVVDAALRRIGKSRHGGNKIANISLNCQRI